MIYREIPEFSEEEIKQAVVNNDVDKLLRNVISVALYSEDANMLKISCIMFSNHANFNLRGNSILGFGHVARIHNKLDKSLVKPIIEKALLDENEFVRGQAENAKDDTELILKWKYK